VQPGLIPSQINAHKQGKLAPTGLRRREAVTGIPQGERFGGPTRDLTGITRHSAGACPPNGG
jgi:hypothetical protein